MNTLLGTDTICLNVVDESSSKGRERVRGWRLSTEGSVGMIACIIIVLFVGLDKTMGNITTQVIDGACVVIEMGSSNARSNQQGEIENKHTEKHRGVLIHHSLTQLVLLHAENRRANLLARTEPEQKHRMPSVNLRNNQQGQLQEKK